MTHVDRSRSTTIYLPSSASTTGQVPLSAIATLDVEQLAAADLASQAVPGDDDLVQPRARRLARRRRSTRSTPALADIGLPASFDVNFQGAAQAFQASLSNEVFLLLAAILTMYIVLGVLYESFIHPITILSTLPSAGIGALLALNAAGAGLDIIGVIGIVLLIGIVKKNAIMMIDFALDARAQRGLDAARRRSTRPACCGCGRS